MQNKDDPPLELDDYDDMDASYEDEFYEDVLDEAFDLEDEAFADDIENFDDDTSSNEGWDDVSTVPGAGAAQSSGRKINLSFNTIVIGGAIILGAGVLFVQLTKAPKTNANADRFTSAVNMQGATDGTVFGETGNENVQSDKTDQDQGFLFEPEILDSMEMDMGENTPPQPMPINDIENIENIENIEIESAVDIDPQPLEIRAVKEDVPRAPVTPEATQENINLEKDVVVQDIETLEKPQPNDEILIVEEPVLLNPEVSTAVEVETKPAVVDNSQAMQAIEKKLDMIVNRLDDLDGRIDQVTDENKAALDKMKQNIKAVESKTNSKATVKATAARPTSKKVSKPKTVSAPKQKVAPVKPKVWELKAAQPGKAWVSLKGKSDIKAIAVGDTLEGLGRITAISFNNRRWTVKTTKGQIKQ